MEQITMVFIFGSLVKGEETENSGINKKLREENAFIPRVMEQPKIGVIGCDDGINEFRKPV